MARGSRAVLIQRADVAMYVAKEANSGYAIYSIDDDRHTGVEALVRWHHPERGLVMPDEFIHVAQKTGLIRPLTLYVIDEALRQCRAWSEHGHEIAIAVNISPRSLIDAEFPDDVERLQRKWDVGPELPSSRSPRTRSSPTRCACMPCSSG